jgi:hypothetical protein
MSPSPTPDGPTGPVGPIGKRRRRAPGAASGAVVALDAHRIERALAGRARYKYVKPRIEREGTGWKVVSPNCSPNIDRAGGEVDIAWFEPAAGGRWRLHARDHARGCWVLKADGVTLPQALALVCADTGRVFWQ